MARIDNVEVQEAAKLVNSVEFFPESTRHSFRGVVWIDLDALPSFFYDVLMREHGFEQETMLEKPIDEELLEEILVFVEDFIEYMNHSEVFIPLSGFIFEGGGDYVHFLFEADTDTAAFFLSTKLQDILTEELKDLLVEAVLDKVDQLPDVVHKTL